MDKVRLLCSLCSRLEPVTAAVAAPNGLVAADTAVENATILLARTSAPFHEKVGHELSAERAMCGMQTIAGHLDRAEAEPAFTEPLHECISL